ncbi:hypothetical protein IEN91_04470 [Bacillus velezensis]|uniref:hypothetical protein n=1 Tax=Bacillus velezensis TaxID=492670 RepID=UPI0018C78A7E|nr:hypothetical protein [Bacillus velezensis]QPK89709.1 hypothetical protein IEN91_04470 [Bacillus velezensis]
MKDFFKFKERAKSQVEFEPCIYDLITDTTTAHVDLSCTFETKVKNLGFDRRGFIVDALYDAVITLPNIDRNIKIGGKIKSIYGNDRKSSTDSFILDLYEKKSNFERLCEELKKEVFKETIKFIKREKLDRNEKLDKKLNLNFNFNINSDDLKWGE